MGQRREPTWAGWTIFRGAGRHPVPRCRSARQALSRAAAPPTPRARAARPRADRWANACTTRSASCAAGRWRSAGRPARAGGGPGPRADRPSRFAATVADGAADRVRRSRPGVAASTPLRSAFSAVAVRLAGRCRAPAPAPSPAGRRDGQHARAAAEVEQRRRRRSSSSSSRQSRVVAWAPVPNAWPGSITMSSAVSPAGSHGGRTVSRSPSTSGRWNSRQRSAQSSGTSVVDTSISTPPAAARRSGSAGSSPGGAVDRVLHRARRDSVSSTPPAPAPAVRRARAPPRRGDAQGHPQTAEPVQPPNARRSLANTPSSVRRF